jgi:hypothetical protein
LKNLLQKDTGDSAAGDTTASEPPSLQDALKGLFKKK